VRATLKVNISALYKEKDMFNIILDVAKRVGLESFKNLQEGSDKVTMKQGVIAGAIVGATAAVFAPVAALVGATVMFKATADSIEEASKTST